MVLVTSTVQLNWRVPVESWERFEDRVYEKHGETGPYLRFELEQAMREYLDEDGILAEAEELLREHTHLRGLSSSADTNGTARYTGADTKKVTHRINPDLKERFIAFAKEHDASSYGRLVAAALDSYAEGGRARRILEDVRRLVEESSTGGTTRGSTAESDENADPSRTGRGTSADSTAGSDENAVSSGSTGGISVVPGESADGSSSASTGGTTNEVTTCGATASNQSIQQRSGSTAGSDESRDENDVQVTHENDDGIHVNRNHLLAIVDELDPSETFGKGHLYQTIVDVTGESDQDVLDAYFDAALEQIPATEHPDNNKLCMTEEYRESCEVYDDMDRAVRICLLRRYSAARAIERGSARALFRYDTCQELFKDKSLGGSPSHDYVYKLMRGAADAPGFEFGEFGNQLALEVDLTEVESEVLADAEERTIDGSLDDLMIDVDITSYTAGSAPNQESAADDD